MTLLEDSPHPLPTDIRLCSGYFSKTRTPPCSDLTVSLKAIYNYLPLSRVLPKVSKDLFLIWIILTDPLKAALHEALDVSRVEGEPEIEDLSIVAVVVAYSSPAGEGLLPSSPTTPVG